MEDIKVLAKNEKELKTQIKKLIRITIWIFEWNLTLKNMRCS